MYDVLVGGYLIRYFSTVSACFRTLILFLSFGVWSLLTPFVLTYLRLWLSHLVCFRFQAVLSIKLRYRAQIIERAGTLIQIIFNPDGDREVLEMWDWILPRP